MRTPRSAIAGIIALTLAAVVGPAAATTAAPPTAPYDVFTISGLAEEVATPANTTEFSLTTNGSGFFMKVDFAEDARLFYQIAIDPPTGQTLAVGTFPTLYWADATHGALRINTGGSGCGLSAGSVTIHAISRDGANAITSVAASYELANCSGSHPVKGELRWKSSVGYVMAQATQRMLGFGEFLPGDTSQVMPVTLRSMGSGDLHLGAATITGADADDFHIASDSCSEDSLTYDQTCAVSLYAHPTATGNLSAKLEIPSNTVGGKEVVELSVTSVESRRGTFAAVPPTRILDTRAVPGRPVGPGETIDVRPSDYHGVAGKSLAVVLNVTVTGPTSSGHITIFPAGQARPVASALNFVPGWTGANSVTVATGVDGKVSLYNSSGNTHLVVDVMGFYYDSTHGIYPGGGTFFPLEPQRLLDTRAGFGKLGPGESVDIHMDFGADNADIAAWVVNVTSTEAEQPGYLATWDGNPMYPTPSTSTLNLNPGTTVPNLAVVPSRPSEEGQTIAVFASNTTHVIVDILGYYGDSSLTGGLRFEPNPPTRIVDSRFGQGTPGALGPGGTAVITTPSNLVDEFTYGLALNLTGISPTASTFMTVWGGDGMQRPGVSNLNPSAGQIIPNAVITELDSNNRFNVYNNGGTTHFVADVVGRFYWYPYE